MKHHIIQKRIEYFKAFNEESEDQCLMQTIRIPKNLLFLSDKLPQQNYERVNINNSGELPEIRQLNQRKKNKNKENQENLENIESLNAQLNSKVKKNIRDNSGENMVNQLKNPSNEEEPPIKILDKREKSPK